MRGWESKNYVRLPQIIVIGNKNSIGIYIGGVILQKRGKFYDVSQGSGDASPSGHECRRVSFIMDFMCDPPRMERMLEYLMHHAKALWTYA